MQKCCVNAEWGQEEREVSMIRRRAAGTRRNSGSGRDVAGCIAERTSRAQTPCGTIDMDLSRSAPMGMSRSGTLRVNEIQVSCRGCASPFFRRAGACAHHARDSPERVQLDRLHRCIRLLASLPCIDFCEMCLNGVEKPSNPGHGLGVQNRRIFHISFFPHQGGPIFFCVV